MTITEKAAYLKGLADGLNYDKESAEGKLITALIELTSDLADLVDELDEDLADLEEYVDEIDTDLGDVEDYLLDEGDYDFDDEDEEYEEGFDFGDEETTIYEVKCACGHIIDFDEETLEEGSIECPECGELLEFSLEDEDEE